MDCCCFAVLVFAGVQLELIQHASAVILWCVPLAALTG